MEPTVSGFSHTSLSDSIDASSQSSCLKRFAVDPCLGTVNSTVCCQAGMDLGHCAPVCRQLVQASTLAMLQVW